MARPHSDLLAENRAVTLSPATAATRHATAVGTRRYVTRSERTHPAWVRTLPREHTVGALGMGTYLGDCTDEEDARYRAAVREALERGVNVLDTASNYRCQRSERAVGQALEEAIAAGTVRRDEVVVCTKGGYVALDGAPPPTRAAYDRWLHQTLIDPGVIGAEDLVRGGHALTARFVAHQLAQSRANLCVSTIDLYYLHNPEEQLLALDRERFLARIREVFELLEERASEGEIGGYGCATWAGLLVPPEHRQHLSLVELVAVAREIAGAGHHFRAVQLPVSLSMPEATSAATQALGRGRVPLLEAATALGLGVVASAPLMQGRLVRDLPPEVGDEFPECRTDAQRALRFVTSLPGVTLALAGMREVAHLRENLDAWPTT